MIKLMTTLGSTRRYINTLRHKLILAETKALSRLLERELHEITTTLNALLKEETPTFYGVQIIEGKKANQILQLVILESMLRLPLCLRKEDIYMEAIHYLTAAEDFVKRLKEDTSDKRISLHDVIQALSILKSRGVKMGILNDERNLVVCLPTFQDPCYFAHYFFQSNVICCLSGTDNLEFLLHELGHLVNYRLTNNTKVPPHGYREALAQCRTQWGISITESFADDFAAYFLNEKGMAGVMQDYFANLCHSLR